MDGAIEYPLINADAIAGDAWTAMGRQDSAEALRLWQELRREFPDRPEGFVWPIQVLWQEGRLDEADTAAAEALARFPDDAEIFVQHAWIAMARENWDAALGWWARARAATPERLETYLWSVRALWKAGRLDDADAIAAEAFERFPGNADVQAECAWIAVNRQDWEAALRYWSLVHGSGPERLDARLGMAQALRNLGHIDEAEPMLAAALAGHPDNPDLLVEHVWLAVSGGDWDEAAARLDAARAKLADPKYFEDRLGWVAYQLRARAEQVGAPAPASPAPPAVVADGELSVADLMLSFESLGERCDFGAVQRHFGVEPLGLLRFAFSRFDALLGGLEDRLAAVGTPEDTGFELWQDETILYMKKYGLVFHTFVYQKELPTAEKRDAFREQQRRRLLFLKNKLVEDLEDPQKIYIYSSDERTSDADVARLFAALRAYGPNTLLYVRPADPNHPEGSVDRLQDGLYAGYYPRLTNFLAGEQPPFELWRQMCERTYALARAPQG